ncbi:MAG: 3-deoxy-D-manno-octulosonic acid transferase [Flavobacteriales bacterium]|nr:3-deoxy-D-manno-octulosonic acid transferase [Flavobacteriales bacterium]|tara:strand:- start:2565 stop:3755 length:1191 start_codon:yes stop_codon:yes gene_type:complete
MRFLYNIFIFIYHIGLRVYSLFNDKAKQIILEQKDLIHKIINETKNYSNIVWFHAASLGEFEQGKNVIQSYKKKNPTHKILLTFYSPSGYDYMKNNEIADWVFYMPHDSPKNAKLFTEQIKPIKVIFIKYEFWFNYIHQLYIQKIPIYFISCKFRKEQYFFRFYGKWFAKELKKITLIFVQDEDSNNLLKSINIRNSIICGDTRFDTVLRYPKKDFNNPIIKKFIKHNKVLVLGSVWKEDLKLITETKKLKNYKIIVAPHEMTQVNLFKGLEKSILLSEANSNNVSNSHILIIDKVGILSKIYRYATIAYIGGGFGKGIHNTLEAAVYNTPILIGPNYYKFSEAKDLINKKLALVVKNPNEFIQSIRYFENIDIKESSKEYFNSNKGATKKILGHI